MRTSIGKITERESLEERKDVLVFRFHLGMPYSHHVGDRLFFSSQTLSAEKHRGVIAF